MTQKLTKITQDKFLRRFVPLYHDRYGDYNMGELTIKLWQKRLYNSIPWEQFVVVYENLIETHDRAFGLNAIFTRHKSMFPPVDPSLAMEKEYRKNWNPDDESKRAELSRIMSGYVTALNRAKKKGVKASFDWVKEYAHKTVEVFGKEEANTICIQMKHSSYSGAEMFRFCEEINLILRGN